LTIDDRPSPISSDLAALSTERAAVLAAALHQLLVNLHFDVVNRELRLPQYGGDYDLRPFPLPRCPVDVADMKVRLRQAMKASPDAGERRLARRIQYAFMFFMFGEALPREPLDELFGDETRCIEEGLDLGLFTIEPGHTVRTNGLSLFSRRLRDGGVIHLFADTPPHFERRMSATPRVYIGADSYELVDRVSALDRPAGCCVEMGSGSGIQLVSALKHHPHLSKAVGKERDRRALNVSAFNAAMNGVADRMTVVGPEVDLRAELNGHTVAFAMTNPPFLAVPAELDVEGGNQPLDLRAVFPSAGWGGEDGLDVTRRFIDELQPLLVADALCLIYSQFAGDDHGPTYVRKYAEGAGFDFRFEPLPPRRVCARDPDTNRVLEGCTQPVLSAGQAAASTARLIVAALLGRRFPQRLQSAIRKGSPEHALLLSLASTLEKSYLRQAITHFHDGFAILTRGADPRHHEE
jgi:methylase of polypeptide subunit release factors